jgi:hypothetical protein
MAALPGKVKPEWVHFTDRRLELVVISPVEGWISHYGAGRGKSPRCGGVRCALCAIGNPKQVRFVMLCMDDRGNERLLELRERHRKIVERIHASLEAGEGVRIVGRKEGKADNSPVSVNVIGVEHVYIRTIANLVATFGEAPKLLPEISSVEALEDQPEALYVDDRPLQRSPV